MTYYYCRRTVSYLFMSWMHLLRMCTVLVKYRLPKGCLIRFLCPLYCTSSRSSPILVRCTVLDGIHPVPSLLFCYYCTSRCQYRTSGHSYRTAAARNTETVHYRIGLYGTVPAQRDLWTRLLGKPCSLQGLATKIRKEVFNTSSC